MKRAISWPLLLGLQAVALSGCGLGGGSGLVGLFGSGSEEVVSALTNSDQGGTEEIINSSAVTGGSGGGSEVLLGDSEVPAGEIAAAAAVVHHPEPASLALFGGGMAGVAWIRRRRAKRSSVSV